jgi:UDP-N-acetylmuramoyl-tripeptide--D-alanyl-D-alanine ligase
LNALSAIAVGRLFDISPLKIKEGIENFALTKNRMEITTINDINIINDAYNANLDSMKMALKYLGTLNGRKIAILGDMLELGSFSENMHREVAKYIIGNNIDIILLTGNYSKYIMEELNNQKEVYWFNNNDELFNKLITIINKNDNILFKASNGMKFIDIHNKLKEYLTK